MNKILYISLLLVCKLQIIAQQFPCNDPVIPVFTDITNNILSPPPPPPPVSFSDCDNNGIPDNDPNEGDGDTDLDGIANKCDADNDGDGVNDEDDDCILVQGSNRGCPTEQDLWRKIFFVHGLKGNDDSWAEVRSYYQGVLTEEIMPIIDYGGTQNSMNAASGSLASQIEPLTLTDPKWKDKKNFIIAHSLGGIVSRYLQEKMNTVGNEVPYDGIVTFGSCHLGAKAADIKVNQPYKYEYVIQDACEKLLHGKIQETINTNFVLDLFLSYKSIEVKLDKICNKLSTLGLDFLENTLSAGVEAELVTSNASSFPTPATTYNVAFYGVETEDDETLTPRFAGAYIKPPTTYPVFEAGSSDDEGMKAFNEHLTLFTDKYEFYLDRAFNPPWWCHLPLTGWNANCNFGLNFEIAWAYKKAVDWFPTLNSTYKSLIGATEVQIINSYTCTISTSGSTYTYPVYTPSQCACNGIPNCTATLNLVSSQIIQHDKPSDGFILVESAQALPNNVHVSDMPGSNHLQMRNDLNTKDKLDKLFQKKIHPYFKTK